ncbi:hypothetical protein [Ruegeria atlantica]|uniref:hypothetical protein n=1 Tax=Ruegeria atlantica TaxID=81569 RepID=UPI00147AFB75|nr:hypothetical protein [Ruegeria atlantica]
MKLDFDVTRDARTVVIVAMSARSGSSWLVEQLKQSRDFVHFRGELTTFLRRHGLTPPKGNLSSEALNAGDVEKADDGFRSDLSLETGHPLDRIIDANQFCSDILRRLALQWPTLTFDNRAVDIVTQAVDHEMQQLRPFDPVAFSASLLAKMAVIYPIDPDFYDFSKEPSASADHNYPFDYALESPPLVLFQPWQRADRADIQTKPIIIKSAGDVYRLEFYKALFKNAQVRVLHLQRNPAASINGLMNAWLSKKYQSFRVGDLNIKGYSDLASWRKEWWKLDLFPGWIDYRNSDLPTLCAAQWATAQTSVLNWCEKERHQPFKAHYEDMTSSSESRSEMVEGLCDWLQVPRFQLTETRLMNASVAPRKAAWRDRAANILPLISTAHIKDLSAQLGYEGNVEDWI